MLSNLITKTQLKHMSAANPHNNFLTPDTIGSSIFHGSDVTDLYRLREFSSSGQIAP